MPRAYLAALVAMAFASALELGSAPAFAGARTLDVSDFAGFNRSAVFERSARRGALAGQRRFEALGLDRIGRIDAQFDRIAARLDRRDRRRSRRLDAFERRLGAAPPLNGRLERARLRLLDRGERLDRAQQIDLLQIRRLDRLERLGRAGGLSRLDRLETRRFGRDRRVRLRQLNRFDGILDRRLERVRRLDSLRLLREPDAKGRFSLFERRPLAGFAPRKLKLRKFRKR